MASEQAQDAHRRFVLALQREALLCSAPGCGGPMQVTDLSRHTDRVKTYEAVCEQCGRRERLAGRDDPSPPWDEGALAMMAEAHLLHDQPACPADETPVVFVSMPNPRRKARYRLCCFYCGRQAEMDWPPPEAKR